MIITPVPHRRLKHSAVRMLNQYKDVLDLPHYTREEKKPWIKSYAARIVYYETNQRARIARRCHLKKFKGIEPAQPTPVQYDSLGKIVETMANIKAELKKTGAEVTGYTEICRLDIKENLKKAR